MITCLICDHKTSEFAKTNNRVIFKCTYCGFGQTENLDAQAGGYHRDETYIQEEALFKNIFQKRVNIILAFKKNGKALEVGCSTGLMLSLLKKKGFEVLGIEISKKAADEAKRRGINVIISPFEKINFSESFDLIIFNHTLEHLENPVSVLKKTNSMLSKNGLIYIDVPNLGGLSAKIYGKNWGLLLPEEHLWHFSLKSFKILLENLGFKIIFVERASGIWDLENPLLGIFQSLIGFKKRFFIEVLTAIPSWLVSKFGAGSDLMVIARKM